MKSVRSNIREHVTQISQISQILTDLYYSRIAAKDAKGWCALACTCPFLFPFNAPSSMSSRILTNIENTYSLYSVIFFIPQSGALIEKRIVWESHTDLTDSHRSLHLPCRSINLCRSVRSVRSNIREHVTQISQISQILTDLYYSRIAAKDAKGWCALACTCPFLFPFNAPSSMSSRILTNIENTYSLYSVIFFIPQSGALIEKRIVWESHTDLTDSHRSLCSPCRSINLCRSVKSVRRNIREHVTQISQISQIFVALEEWQNYAL